ncbi:MAG: hypothetical protein M1827_001849 [Pycnora praestabilis]|nr:MAG: hypothetical protein M1827_001849 [Pycnora praestabilis]
MKSSAIVGLCGLLSTQLFTSSYASPIDSSVTERALHVRTTPLHRRQATVDPSNNGTSSSNSTIFTDSSGNTITVILGWVPDTPPVIASRDIDLAPRGKSNPQCYGSGSWSTNNNITATVPAVCSDVFEYTKPDGVPQASGVEQYNEGYLYNEAGDLQTLAYSYTANQGATFATADFCRAAYTQILDHCSGKHEDTRGGIYTYSDGTVFSVDPSTKCGHNPC